MNSVFWPDPSKINPKTLYEFPRIVLAEQAGSIFGSKFETVTEHGGSKNDPNLKIENLGIFKHNMHKNHFWSDFLCLNTLSWPRNHAPIGLRRKCIFISLGRNLFF